MSHEAERIILDLHARLATCGTQRRDLERQLLAASRVATLALSDTADPGGKLVARAVLDAIDTQEETTT